MSTLVCTSFCIAWDYTDLATDFLATYSLDDDTFGEFIWLTEVPTSGNSPHHLGVSLDGKTLVGGGLLSLLKTQGMYNNSLLQILWLLCLVGT